MSTNNRFDDEAAAWDSNPTTVQSSRLAFEALVRFIPELNDNSEHKLDVLEIGCGTGLLSFLLSPHVHTLLGVDTAQGMVNAFRAKIPQDASSNVAAITHFLSDPDAPELQAAARSLTSTPIVRWDLVVSHLTLHHIPVLADILATAHACLVPGGRVALTDFEDTGADAVLFHPANARAGVERHGIQGDEMARLMREAGFVDVRVERAFVLPKAVDAQEAGGRTEIEFPFLICLGTRDVE